MDYLDCDCWTTDSLVPCEACAAALLDEVGFDESSDWMERFA